MDKYLTRALSRQVDQRAINEYGMAGIQLMENAGRGCAELIERLGVSGPVVICCGKGNNAGDGFVIARHLEARGHKVKILLWCPAEQLRGDASFNQAIVHHAGTPLVECDSRFGMDWLVDELRGADWIVDALFGTGSSGPPRAPFNKTIQVMNDHPAKKFAVDLPSGLDCDTGEAADPTFRADYTATFVAPKVGFQQPSAKKVLGVVHSIDIGVPQKLLQEIFANAK
jgi:NAD(P)H-hydrate epimerase